MSEIGATGAPQEMLAPPRNCLSARAALVYQPDTVFGASIMEHQLPAGLPYRFLHQAEGTKPRLALIPNPPLVLNQFCHTVDMSVKVWIQGMTGQQMVLPQPTRVIASPQLLQLIQTQAIGFGQSQHVALGPFSTARRRPYQEMRDREWVCKRDSVLRHLSTSFGEIHAELSGHGGADKLLASV